MNKRQAKKIVQLLILFRQKAHNYQPYSKIQQRKAFRRLGCRMNEIGVVLSYKVPIKYRYYDPRRVAKAMLIYRMQPTCAAEYDRCMRELESMV